jgi:hypothetical protein
MLIRRGLIATAIIAALLGCMGCQGTFPAQKETQLDRNWGRSYETAKYNQMLNPEAGKNQDPVEGLDGHMAEKAVEEYRKGPEKGPGKEWGILTIRSRQQ